MNGANVHGLPTSPKRRFFDQYADEVVEMAMADDAVLTDIDTPEALERIRTGRSPGS